MNRIDRSIGTGAFLLIAGVSGLSAADEEITLAPQAVVFEGQAALYPVAFNNAQGLNSVLVLTTLSEQGNYIVCRDLSGSPDQCISLQQLPSGVSAHTMDELGIASGSAGMVVVQAVDAATEGIASLVVQSPAGGVDFPPSYTVSLAAGSGQASARAPSRP